MINNTRIADIFLSAIGLILLLPLFIIIALLVKITSKGPVFFMQQRVGRNNLDFTIYKFRTMVADTGGSSSFLTIGANDNRNTGTGAYLRRYKLDELPQLLNVLKGDMSIVGPRPEVRRYVNLYTEEQKKILSVQPGMTDWASIRYKHESQLLAMASDPEKYYIEEIMPAKIELNKQYIEERTLRNYFTIIFQTILTINKTSVDSQLNSYNRKP